MTVIADMIDPAKLADGRWWNLAWSLVYGCTQTSPGCEHCWLKDMSLRWHWVGKWGHAHPQERNLTIPLKRKKPTVYTIWADLFHEDVPDTFIDKAMAVMALSPQHLFPVLTKRAERLPEYLNWLSMTPDENGARDRVDRWGQEMNAIRGLPHSHPQAVFNPLPNFWPGVSAEDQATFDERVPHLLDCPAAVRWISLSPLLGPIDFSETVCADGDHLGPTLVNLGDGAGIDWIVIEGESGPGARPCDIVWMIDIIDQATRAGVPVFVKQLGSHVIDSSDGEFGAGLRIPLKDRNGRDMSEWPKALRIREWPEVSV